jgi:hypothetical protein
MEIHLLIICFRILANCSILTKEQQWQQMKSWKIDAVEKGCVLQTYTR